MREHENNKNDNFIMGYYIEDDVLCDDIINFHKTAEHRYQGTTEYEGEFIVDKNKKDSIDVVLNDNPDLRTRYTTQLQKCLNGYIEKYPYCNNYSAFADLEITNIQYYPKGGGYFEWHTERGGCKLPSSNRHLVFMTYLNTVTDGGETEFYHQNLKVKPEKGLTLIWGADWTFTHRGIPSFTEEKYIVTGWFSFI